MSITFNVCDLFEHYVGVRGVQRLGCTGSPNERNQRQHTEESVNWNKHGSRNKNCVKWKTTSLKLTSRPKLIEAELSPTRRE